MKELVAKYRALVALVLVALCAALPGCHAQTVHSGVNAAMAEAKAHPGAPVTYPETPVARFGMVTGKAGKPTLYRLDPKTGGVRFIDLTKFGVTGDNPAGWSIDPTTGALTAPSGKVIAGVSFKQSPYAVSTTLISTKSGLAQTVDGQALNTAGMRVWQITVGSSDGCWVVASGAWTHCDEAAVGADMAGAFFAVGHGTSNKGLWIVTNAAAAGIVGTNTLTATNLSTLGGGGGVPSVFTRTGAVVAAAGDYTSDQVGALAGIDAAAVTTKALSAYTYANGTAGVGATITGNVNQACDTIDGLTPSLTPGAGSYLHVLVQNGAAFSDNGLYIVTQVGNGSLPCILTRDPRVDTPAEIRASEIHVTQGISRQGAVYKYCNDPTITIGTTALAWLRQDANRINEVSEFRSDFNTITLAPTTGQTTPSDGLFYTITGTGAAVAIAVPASHTENGALTYGTGTTTTGLVTASYAAANRPLILDTSQYVEFEVKVSGPDTLSDGTNTFRMVLGLADNIAVGSITNGIYIQYTQATSTSWLGTNRATSADTTATGSTVSAGATTYRRFLARKFAGESAVHWYDSGSEMTGSPISGAPFGVNLTPVITITKSAGGTSRSFNIDFYRVLIGEINGRAA